MKIAELRGKDSRELKLDMQALSKSLFELRFRGTSEEVSNSSRFREFRRGIARIHTVLREREIADALKADDAREDSSAQKAQKAEKGGKV